MYEEESQLFEILQKQKVYTNDVIYYFFYNYKTLTLSKGLKKIKEDEHFITEQYKEASEINSKK